MKRSLFLAVMLVFSACAARAGVLIYNLSFNNAGPAVNYSFLQGGYLVVDTESFAVTSVVTLTDPTTNLLYYTTGLLSGTYMEIAPESGGRDFAVIYSMSGSGETADNIAFQILGRTGGRTGIGGGEKMRVARKMTGYLLASAAESSSEDGSSFAYGFAGSSKVLAKFQSGLTDSANNSQLDAAGALDQVVTLLENLGIGAEPTPSPSPSPSPSPISTSVDSISATGTASLVATPATPTPSPTPILTP